MMIKIKEKLIIVCLVAALFLFSGCAGLNKNAVKPIKRNSPDKKETIKKTQPDKVLNKPVKLKASDNAAIDSPSPKPAEVVKKKRNLENKRFKRAKKAMNSYRGKKSKPGGISFNFDNADLYEVVQTMADILNINFILGSNIRGKVTIHSAGKFNKSDLFPLFFQILELNGLTAVKDGNLYKIITKDKILNTPVLTRYGRDLNNIPQSERMVMQIIPLQYVKPNIIIPSLTPFLSNSGKILPREDSDILIIIDKASNMKRLIQLVDIFDIDLFDNINYKFFKLYNIGADEALKLLDSLIGPYLKLSQSETKIVSIKRLNTLAVISNNELVLDKIQMFINKIDIQDNSVDSRIFIYKVKNSKAEDLASLLNQLFNEKDNIYNRKASSGKVKEQAAKNSATKLFIRPDSLKNNIKKPVRSKTGMDRGMRGGASLTREITIIPDPVRNALIIEAAPSDYAMVKQILKEIDVLPRQVLIDVLILDVNITGNTTFGIDWSFLRDRVGGKIGVSTAAIKSTGLTFTAGVTEDWVAAVRAIASDNRADVLSAPSILASDNKPAVIHVVTQIPIATSTYDTEKGVTTTSIQYRDTGIILNVTPHINDTGMVSMEINQEVSSQVESSADAKAPSFFNRTISTTLSVKDKQTIVIGGLISNTKTKNSKGVPVLARLPFIGFLFGEKKNTMIKNELIVMITPKVITTLNDIDSVSKEFTEKFYGLKKHKKIIELLPD